MTSADERRWERHAGPVLDAKDGFDVIDCATCGFRHAVPLPTPETLARAYRHDYYVTEKPLYLERHREDRDWWDTVYRRRYERLEALLPPAADGSAARPRLLDVGCGPGFFLRHGADRGWIVLGIEPSAQAAAHARGLGIPVVKAVLDAATAAALRTSEAPFDVVHLHQVLEHVPDPAATLALAHGLLRPDGLLFVAVPNDYNPLQRHLREHLGYPPWWVVPPHHLNYFDRASLGRLLARCGFAVVHETTSFPMEVFLLMGERYVAPAPGGAPDGNEDAAAAAAAADATGRRVHGLRKTLETNAERGPLGDALQALYEALAPHDVGRECVVVARRGPAPTGAHTGEETIGA